MIRPIVAYGDPVLKKEAEEVEKQHPGLLELIEDMWETMYAADGVGLAAPQVGLSLRLFVADGSPFGEGEDGDPGCRDFTHSIRLVAATDAGQRIGGGCR